MDILQTLILSVSMAADTMCVGASDGIKENKIGYLKITFIAFVFAFMQFIMPVIGYFIGFSFKNYLEAYIPWIAFVILTLLGIKSLYEGIKENINRKKDNKEEKEEEKKIGILEIFIQGIATLIDALSIGFININLSINDAMITFSIIGIVTFVLSFLATALGKLIGTKIEKIAPIISGLIFIDLGLKFIIQHYIKNEKTH